MAGGKIMNVSKVIVTGSIYSGMDVGLDVECCDDLIMNNNNFNNNIIPVKTRGVRSVRAKGNIEHSSSSLNLDLLPPTQVAELVSIYIHTLRGNL